MIATFDEYKKEYKKSIENPEAFLDDIAKQFTWKQPWTKTLTKF